MVRKARRDQAHIVFHRRADDAGPEQLRQVLGIFALKGPRPSGKFLDCKTNVGGGMRENTDNPT
jgi:hypothetical protein